MHLCLADVARAVFWPRAINPPPSCVTYKVEHVASPASPSSLGPVPKLPAPPPAPPALSRLDSVCSRYWRTHQAVGAFLGGYARWDPDGIVVAACAFARDLLCPSEVDYDDFTLRVAVGATSTRR